MCTARDFFRHKLTKMASFITKMHRFGKTTTKKN
jgi:hypothetical protein